jgi:glutathione synthase/RimK-type ligase-like ATP-grasp enzyme
LAWPSASLGLWRDVYEERLRILAAVTKKPIVPSLEEVWLFDSKRRVREWLRATGVPHPETHVFLDESPALEFVRGCSLPVVCKLNAGATSHGVFIIRTRRQATRFVKRAFSRGLRSKHRDRREREWGSILLQEYVPHDAEWRVARIGADFLCRLKWRVGDFASGGRRVEYARPGPELLDFAERVTDLGGFRSMVLDMFEPAGSTNARTFLVNEMQCLVGAAPHQESPHRGRWRRVDGTWQFEPGDFYRNACANLRVRYALELAGVPPPAQCDVGGESR